MGFINAFSEELEKLAVSNTTIARKLRDLYMMAKGPNPPPAEYFVRRGRLLGSLKDPSFERAALRAAEGEATGVVRKVTSPSASWTKKMPSGPQRDVMDRTLRHFEGVFGIPR